MMAAVLSIRQRAIRRARVPWYRQAKNLRADGDTRLRRLGFECDGARIEIEAGLLLLHQGIIPALQLIDAAGCDIDWSETQQCWRPRLDAWGETSKPGIFVAGDGAAIGGARVAALAGSLAGLQAACGLGRIGAGERDRLARALRRALRRHLAIRPFLDSYYRIDTGAVPGDDDTLVCRCEEVSAAQIRAVAELGCAGPNQVKAFTRCGMGPCQGRFCGASVESLLARQQGRGVDEIGRFKTRPPIKPVTLGQLAAANGDQS